MAGEQKPSSNLLEQFILLAKGTSGSALTALISQVLEAPGVYVFGELLELANVQEVRAVSKQFLCLLCSKPSRDSPGSQGISVLKHCGPVRGVLLREDGNWAGGRGKESKDDVLGSVWSIFSCQLGVKLDWVTNNLKDRGKIHLNLINKKSRV